MGVFFFLTLAYGVTVAVLVAAFLSQLAEFSRLQSSLKETERK